MEFVDPCVDDPHPDGVDLSKLDERGRSLHITHRRWNAWAKHARTDTPPDVYAGETRSDGIVATENLWNSDGQLVDEASYVAAQTAKGR